MLLKGKISNIEINYDEKMVEIKIAVSDENDNHIDLVSASVPFENTKQETKQVCEMKIKQLLRHVKNNIEAEQSKPPAAPSHIDFADKELEYESETEQLTWIT